VLFVPPKPRVGPEPPVVLILLPPTIIFSLVPPVISLYEPPKIYELPTLP